MPSVVFYISGHGFGHTVRQIAIINALGARLPAADLVVCTSAPRRLFDQTVRAPIVSRIALPFAVVPGLIAALQEQMRAVQEAASQPPDVLPTPKGPLH